MHVLKLKNIVKFWNNETLSYMTGLVVRFNLNRTVGIEYSKSENEDAKEYLTVPDTQIKEVWTEDGEFKPYCFWDSKWESGEYV